MLLIRYSYRRNCFPSNWSSIRAPGPTTTGIREWEREAPLGKGRQNGAGSRDEAPGRYPDAHPGYANTAQGDCPQQAVRADENKMLLTPVLLVRISSRAAAGRSRQPAFRGGARPTDRQPHLQDGHVSATTRVHERGLPYSSLNASTVEGADRVCASAAASADLARNSRAFLTSVFQGRLGRLGRAASNGAHGPDMTRAYQKGYSRKVPRSTCCCPSASTTMKTAPR